MSKHADRYRARFRKVLDYIDAHLDEALTVEQLAGLAAVSKYHFHRQFSEIFGIGVSEYVRLRRLKRASFRLAFRARHSVMDIALACGYDGPEAFARAFRKALGQSPSEFRKAPQWAPWHRRFQTLHEQGSRHMSTEHCIEDVRIVDFPATRVAVLEHRGAPTLLGDSIRRFIEWRKLNRLPPAVSSTFNLLYGDPASIAPGEFRLDLCAATDGEIAANEHGVVGGIIPGGRCAVLRHVGSDDMLGEAARFLYATWLPQSGEEQRDFPLFVQRRAFFPDVPEHEAVTDIFLPLR